MGNSGVRIALACEDNAHCALATFLTDRVILTEALLRRADWIDQESLRWFRSYCGLNDPNSAADEAPDRVALPCFYPLKQARKDVEELGKLPRMANGRTVRLRGYIDGKPLKPEAGAWRRIVLLFAAAEPRPDVLIVTRDTDGDPTRLDGLRQVLDHFKAELPRPLPIVVAAPHQDAESWFVAGFVPQNAAERKRLSDLTAAISFSPLAEPHRLTAHPNDAPTDAKRVLRILAFDEDVSRPPTHGELPDLCERTLNDLDLLERHGACCGICAFLQELRTILVPLMMGASP